MKRVNKIEIKSIDPQIPIKPLAQEGSSKPESDLETTNVFDNGNQSPLEIINHYEYHVNDSRSTLKAAVSSPRTYLRFEPESVEDNDQFWK